MPLHERVRNEYPTTRRAGVPLMAFLAEAPGDTEVIDGRPLVGASGQLFNRILKSAGLRRDEVWVGNAFQRQFPDNDESRVCVSPKAAEGVKLPPYSRDMAFPREWEADVLAVREELRALRPDIIVTMGSIALWALSGAGSGALDNVRGYVTAVPHLDGLRLLATYHPARIFKEWKLLPTVTADFEKARRIAAGSGLGYAERKLILEPSGDDLVDFLALAQEHPGPLVVDIETIPRWRAITQVGFSLGAGPSICIPFSDSRKENNCYWGSVQEELDAWEIVRLLCALPCPKLLQNGLYDAFWLYDLMRIPVINYREDTRLKHHALYPELPKSLLFMGSRYASVPPWKKHRVKHTTEKRDD